MSVSTVEMAVREIFAGRDWKGLPLDEHERAAMTELSQRMKSQDKRPSAADPTDVWM